jgi:hypothetical protein
MFLELPHTPGIVIGAKDQMEFVTAFDETAG